VLFVGNASKPHKNLDNVIQAYARARQLLDFDVPLVCVGDRSSAEYKLRKRAEQLGLGDHVQLLGHVAAEALPAIYQGAALFVYPTLYEGFGLPVIEAMASGVPVITSNTSALKEIAEGYAHLVDPLDVEGMARAIARCMSDEGHRKALAGLGLKRAESFHWKRTAERTLEVYRAALADRQPSWRRRLLGRSEAPAAGPGETAAGDAAGSAPAAEAARPEKRSEPSPLGETLRVRPPLGGRRPR
jgi:alpha-1,3-rhamnosyl/mannosyltransferase